jgi:hypothetical protein
MMLTGKWLIFMKSFEMKEVYLEIMNVEISCN